MELIPYENLVAFRSDNASVMQGSIGGVQALLNGICPNLVAIGCSCHSLHLCSSQAAKKLPNTVEQYIRDVYSYFAHSSKRLSEFKECQIFAHEKPHKLLRPSQTRRLSLQAVTDRLLEQWNPLTLYFQGTALEENILNAKAILNALRNPVYKLYFLFLSYILQLIDRVNRDLQSSSAMAPLLLHKITTLYKTVLKYYIKKDNLDAQMIAVIEVNNPRNFLEIEAVYLGANVELYLSTLKDGEINKNDLHSFRLRCLEFYIEFCKKIKKRFNFKHKHLNFINNFSSEVALSGKNLSLTEGMLQFPQIKLNYENVNQEWQLLSETECLKNVSSNDLQEFWSTVGSLKNELGELMFPNLMELVKVGLIIPHSSATAERVFFTVFN